jgi:benzoate-CoA ligase
MNINFANYIIELNQGHLDKIAITDGTQSLTYGQLSDKIKQVAASLTSIGIVPGQCVIICMDDCVDWPVVFLGTIYAGAVPVPVATNIPQDVFNDIVDFVECRLVFVDDNSTAKINNRTIPVISRQQLKQWYDVFLTTALPVKVFPDTPGYMGLSSGSTGLPKVAVFRHQVLFDIVNFVPRALYRMDSSSIMLSLPKMSWGYGLHNTITYTFGVGGTAVIIPGPPNPTTVFRTINKHKPTIISSTPAVLKKLLGPASKRYSIPNSVVCVHSSGEDLPESVYTEFYKRFGIRISASIGQLEVANTLYATTSGNPEMQGTVGKPLPGVKIKIVNSDEQECAIEVVGEIYVRSNTVATYYLNNYKSTKNTFYGHWVKTGDTGLINSDGNLVFVGRVDDVFKVNDLIVSPINVENEILKYSCIDQAVVLGIKNSNQVIEVHAFIVVKERFELSKFKQFLQDKLLNHQIPKHLHIRDHLPETITGKKNRRELSLTANAN